MKHFDPSMLFPWVFSGEIPVLHLQMVFIPLKQHLDKPARRKRGSLTPR